MSGFTVVLDRKDMRVIDEASSIKIECPGRQIRRVPVKLIDSVIVIGNPLVACGVWSLLADNDIPAVILTLRGTRPEVYIGSGLSSNANKRKLQYQIAFDPPKTIRAARLILIRKLKQQEKFLMKINSKEKKSIITTFNSFKNKLYKSSSKQVLMGVEGSTASYYFKHIRTKVPDKWNFNSRNRYPPKDPVNALLSLSYTMSGNEVRREIILNGFDPSVGFLHSIKPGRDSLMLDLLEPLRPYMDEFVLDLISGKLLNLKHFTSNVMDGCRLGKKGREIYFGEWGKYKNSKLQDITAKNVKEILDKIFFEKKIKKMHF